MGSRNALRAVSSTKSTDSAPSKKEKRFMAEILKFERLHYRAFLAAS
jgi:hypothetical protein